ncbi:MAG: DUF4157 domain-containing protein, partial [Chloroflexi bacterium]|nr:DUF4157 domain-containing protein [Chloroflexota bacterium]
MAEDYNIDHDEKSFKRQTERLDDDTSHAHRSDAGSESATDYPASLLGDSKLSARGNTSVQTTVMQRMQQSYGNKAVQRFLQRSASGATDQVEEESIASRIQSKSGGGSSLDGGLQRKLESGLGADMSGVRVHTDGEADHMARSVDAVAFTTGSDIFFRSGAYNPESSQGLHLLAHEATHTVQQSQGPVSGTPSAGGVSISDPSDSFEQAAEQSAANVVAGNPASAAQRAVVSSPPPVQREAEQGEAEEEELQTM